MERPELAILRIDTEFLRLTSCETDEILDLLEHEMTTLKIIPTIYVWRGYIVDGHKRYALCHQCNVPFYIRALNYKTKQEVLVWRCRQLIAEKKFHKSKFFHYYIGKYYSVEHGLSGLGRRSGHNQFTPKEDLEAAKQLPNYKEVANKIAVEAGIKIPSVLKYARECKYMDKIYDMSPIVAKLILQERILVSYETMGDISQLTSFEMNRAERYLQTLPYGYVDIDKLYENVGIKRLSEQQPRKNSGKKKERQRIKPQIKITPKYDPDAEVSSLALTIPSWVSSINRTRDNADFDAITDSAREKLRNALAKMLDSIALLLNELEVSNDE